MNLRNLSKAVVKKVVLIFEPEERAAEAAKTLLRGEGFKVVSISSEDELKAVSDWNGIVGVLLGDRLPGTNPQLVVEWLKRHSAAHEVPVLLLVKSSFAGSIRMHLASRFWVGKPIGEVEFLKGFRGMLEKIYI